MKIVQSVLKVYLERLPLYNLLGRQVDTLVQAKKKKSWHYFSRVKSDESFALKLETGRIKEPAQMEDFFACTLVVENINQIQNAIVFIQENFDIQYRKPRTDEFTHKESSSFEFDDLRLYVKLTQPDYLPQGELRHILFEFQIKTFLQHAWSIATHDFIYKSPTVSWPKERVAFQIKAMLEQAEISISGADKLSELPALDKNNNQSQLLNQIRLFLENTFIQEKALPADRLRLCYIVSDMLKLFSISLDDLELILLSETIAGRGIQTLNLSPYSILLQSIINQRQAQFENVFTKTFNPG